MHTAVILMSVFAAKMLISFVVYLRAKHVLAKMSLPAKGAVLACQLWPDSTGQ
jgi:hypothetical protein